MRTIPVALALVALRPARAGDRRARLGVGRAGPVWLQDVRRLQLQGQRQAIPLVQSAQPKAAFFLSTKHDVTYKVCVKFPGKKKRLCASAQPADKGDKQFMTIATASTGKHRVTWYVDGAKVGSWTFDVTAG